MTSAVELLEMLRDDPEKGYWSRSFRIDKFLLGDGGNAHFSLCA